MRYTVVCFDVGFTLVDERIDANTLLTDVLQASGHVLDPQAIDQARQSALQWYATRYRELDNSDWASDATIRAMWMRFYEHLFTQLDPEIDHQLLAEQLIAHYEDPHNWVPFADVQPTLQGLHERGIRIGVVSDWSRQLRPILHGSGLSRWIDFVVGSADTGYAKPMQELYSLAVKRAQVPPQQIIHVGDSYQADVLGARSVGMAGALIDRQRRFSRLDCPHFHDLRELLDRTCYAGRA